MPGIVNIGGNGTIAANTNKIIPMIKQIRNLFIS
jgi:hypothetical protein